MSKSGRQLFQFKMPGTKSLRKTTNVVVKLLALLLPTNDNDKFLPTYDFLQDLIQRLLYDELANTFTLGCESLNLFIPFHCILCYDWDVPGKGISRCSNPGKGAC
jgi:hypothetical protein